MRHDNPDVKEDLKKEDIHGIHYYWVKTRKYQGNGIDRAIGMAEFVGKIICHAREICSEIKPDVVIASSTYPMDGYAARKIRRISGAKYIHEIHDMWPATLIEIGGMSRKNPFVWINQIAENAFCRHADAVVSIPPATKKYLIRHGMKPEKFFHVPNGIVKEDWENPDSLPQEHQEMIDKLRQDNKFLIVFAGSHNEAYGLEYLIEAIRKLKDERVCAVFVGDGYLKNKLIEDTREERDRFVFLPSISKTAIPSLFEQADTLYVSGTKDNLFRFGISMNKLMDSMMAGRPVLYAVNAPNNYIKKYRCGVSVPPRDSAALAQGIRKLMGMSKEGRDQMGENGRNAALEYFEYKQISENFLKIMKEIGQK